MEKKEQERSESESGAAGLKCSCTVEHLTDQGQVLRKQACKSSVLDLGRNEVEDVVLKLTHSTGVLGPFTIRDYNVHKRFLKEGKATIVLKTQKIQFLISNCPPYHLGGFLQSMCVKVSARGKIQGSHRRMLGDISLKFNEISPLSAGDVEMARQNKLQVDQRLAGKENRGATTPHRGRSDKGMPQKRKLSEVSTSPTKGRAPAGAKLDSSKRKRPVLDSMVPTMPASSSGPATPLSAEQAKVLQLVRNGESVFFTGSAGTGKSYLLRHIIKCLPPDTTFPTASTGSAACLIGGTTLHSFAGIGTGAGSLDKCVSLASREPHISNWRKCRCLVIDEISMVDAEFFDKLEGVARVVRRNGGMFGGIQLVVCGDFLQLPPVSKEREKQFCFQAQCWHRCISHSVELTQVYRQHHDPQFIALLQNIRIGRCPPAVSRLLNDTRDQGIETGGIKATKLYTHKADVESTNDRELAALAGEVRSFPAQDSDPLAERALNTLCPVGRTVELKIGAQVMLTKNINVHRNLVNGARGVVKDFDPTKGYPIVQFVSGPKELVLPEKWTVRCGGGKFATRRQLPLKLAWAISIHKSQGMTLDCVELSLGRCFEAGQAYVALSRARSLHSLKVLDFHPSCVRAHPQVLEFYRCMRRTRRNYIEDAGD